MLIQNLKKESLDLAKALISGESGVGKTSLFKTLIGRTVVISSEKGTKVLEGHDIDLIDISIHDTLKGPDGKPQIMKKAADRIAKLQRVFAWLHDGPKDDKGKPVEYMNVCLDSLTEIGDLYVEFLNEKYPDKKDSFPLWGEYLKMMKSTVRNFRDLPFNVFITVLSKPDKNDVGRRYIGFDVQGSVSDRLPQYFDYVFYLHADAEGKRSIITRKTDTLICKDRSGRLAPQEPCDLGEIMKKIMMKKEKEEGIE